jgi:hypothetical protein
MGGFTVDVAALLGPGAAVVGVDADVPGVAAVVVVINGADGYGVAVGGHGHGKPGVVVGGFTVDVGALLGPGVRSEGGICGDCKHEHHGSRNHSQGGNHA